MMFIKNKIENHWRIPLAAENLGVVVTIHVVLAKGGKVTTVKVKNLSCPLGHRDTCILVKDSALRSVWQASPLANLDPSRYNQDGFDIVFKPT